MCRIVLPPRTCCKNEAQPTASHIPMNNTIEFEKKFHLLNFFLQIQLYCTLECLTPWAWSHFLQQVLGGTIDLVKNNSQERGSELVSELGSELVPN